MTQSLPLLSRTQSYTDPVFSNLEDLCILPEITIPFQDDSLIMRTVKPLPFLSQNPAIATCFSVQPLTFSSEIPENTEPLPLTLSHTIPIKALNTDRIVPLPSLPPNPEITSTLPVTPLTAPPAKVRKRKRNIIDLTDRPSHQVKNRHKPRKISVNQRIINYIEEGIDSSWSPYFGKSTGVLFTSYKQWNLEKGYTVINDYHPPSLRKFSSVFNKALPNLSSVTNLKKRTFIVRLPAQEDCLKQFEANAEIISELFKRRKHDLISQFTRFAIKKCPDIFNRKTQIEKVHALFITFAKEMHYTRLPADDFHSQFASRFKCEPISENQELFYHIPSIKKCMKILSVKQNSN